MTNIRFLKHAIVVDGKRIKVWYSTGKLFHHPEGTITIYAKDYGRQFPSELSPENDTELQTDYFDKDKARIVPGSKYYDKIKKFVVKK